MTISVVDSLIVLSDSWIIFSEILSSELVASSKISILGFTIIDLAVRFFVSLRLRERCHDFQQ